MDLSAIKTGTRLELEIYDEAGERIVPSFKSKFISAIDEKKAVIDAPIYGGILYPVHVNSEMFVFFVTSTSYYGFKARITGRQKIDNTAILEIEQLTDIIRFQRRQYFRFECSVPLRYRIYSSIEKSNAEKPPMIDTFTSDLSGGGLRMKAKESIELNTLLECELKLGEEYNISFIGRVLRSEKRKTRDKYEYEIGITYKKIDNRSKERIIKYIFAEQTRMLRKGLK